MNYIEKLAEVLSVLIDHPQVKTPLLMKFIEDANRNLDADFTIICFKLQKFLKQKGPQIALDLESKFDQAILNKYPFLDDVNASGAYLNFTLNKQVMAKEVLHEILLNCENFALSALETGDQNHRIVIEYPSPNTNKPLHFGHVRNMLLGQALIKLNRKINNQVFETNLMNDRGIHICKSMWAYSKFGDSKTPESENRKSDHFVGDYYVKFAQEEHKLKQEILSILTELEQEQNKPQNQQNLEKISQLQLNIDGSSYGKMQSELQQMLIDWEKQDPTVRELWRKMNDWAEQGFQETFDIFNIHHQKTYYESKIYDKGKEIVYQGVEKGLFEKLPDGAIIARFQKKGLPKQKVLLRSDGTSLYITQDLFLAFEKYNDFQYDQSIYVVGNEQNMQLKVLYKILEDLGMKASNIHYSYGMISLTSGKMKSREGKVVDADDVVEELQSLARNEISSRYPDLNEDQLTRRAFDIAMAALRFFILKYEYARDFVFDPEQSISFEGETGPYILYAYARICSMYRKAMSEHYDVPFDPETNQLNPKFIEIEKGFSALVDEEEASLITLLYQYPMKLRSAAINLKPHELIRYMLDLAQQFTKFYHSQQIVIEEAQLRNARLALCEGVRLILKDCLNLFEINELTEM